MPSPNQNFSAPPEEWKKICKLCFCLLCKQTASDGHVCCCLVCSTEVGSDGIICFSCEKIAHQSSCSSATLQGTHMCKHCLSSQRLGLSVSALAEIDSAETLLSDEHISISSAMLKSQFEKDYVQIMHTGNEHWVTCICPKASPNQAIVFDSLRKTKLSNFLKTQVAMISKTTKDHLAICRKPCMQQKGSYDCALFAIANATEFCFTSKMGFIDYDHKSCVITGILSKFPSLSSRPKKTTQYDDEEQIRVYCDCRLPECFDEHMVSCDNCGKWFHYHCYEIKEEPQGDWF
ncbi:hypothetical protein FOCC_FOCC012378, partial [Frankliniella occidentalis]